MSRPILDGARVRLRPPRESDLPFALRFANDEELRGFLRFHRPIDEREERDWLLGLDDSRELVWLVEERATGEAAGFASLAVEPVPRTAELGIGLLGASRRGRGLGSDALRALLRHAFDELRLQRVFLHVLVDNPAVALYERLGFRAEGTLRRQAFKRGAYRDQLVMGILREEWSA